MPTSAEPTILVDTSVAVALVLEDHEHHRSVVAAIGVEQLGLSGHAAFETYSVLTRLPPPARRDPATIERLLAANFAGSRFLPERAAKALLRQLAELGLAGGHVYDALVGAAARHHGLPLASRDRRAVETYRALSVDVRLLS
ncbi:MAG: type II toxin-antitoxin system VapC family toxin [Acidimicrobiales bacterium]